MISYVEGRLDEVWDNSCIVITNSGIGYDIALPAHTLASLPSRGETVAFYTELSVREDALELFGFATFEEKRAFEVLVSISKIGARTALAILSLFRPGDLVRLVREEDVSSLTRVPGIGRKTAQHVFLELKYKLKTDNAAAVSAGGRREPSVFRDTLDALSNLGYPEEESNPVVRQILDAEPDLDVIAAVRAALKTFAKGRR